MPDMKKSLQITCILFITSVLFSSCSPVFFANPGIDPIVFTKPVYHDSTSVSSFVGGKLNRSQYLNRFESLGNNYFGQVYLFQTITNKYYSTSYGAFGYLGKMGIEDVENNFIQQYKNYFGAGVSAEAQLNIPYQNLNFRPLGIKGSLLYEDGQYYQQRASELGGVFLSPDRFMANISQTSGIDYRFRNSSVGLDISAGYSFMIPHLYTDMTFSAILNYTTPKFMIYLQKSASIIVSNDDLVIGFNYRLK